MNTFDKEQKPTTQARCRQCGVKTAWSWYEYEEDEEDLDAEADDCAGEWVEKLCWRCHEICMMKAEMSLAYLGLTVGGGLTEESADRFIEVMINEADMLKTMQVVRFAYPFPWRKPWCLLSWLVWHIKRRWRRERPKIILPPRPGFH